MNPDFKESEKDEIGKAASRMKIGEVFEPIKTSEDIRSSNY